MSFVCPIEDCTSVFENWPSLKEHLTEEHEQDIARETYDEWLRDGDDNGSHIEHDIEASPDKRPLSASDADVVPDNMARDEADNGVECPICGRSFPTYQSMKMHSIRAHKQSPEPRGEGEPRPRTQGREEAEATISTQADLLSDILRLTKYGKADMVVKLCDTYGYDIYSIHRALREVGAQVSVIRPTISWWASYHNTMIPDEIADTLGIIDNRGGYDRRGGYDGYRGGYRGRQDRWQPEPKDEVSQIIEKEYDELRKIRVIQALQGGGEDSSEIKMIRDEMLNLRDELSRGRDDRVEELEKELQRERELRHRQELEGLRQEFDLKFESLRKEEGGLIERQAVRAIERVGDVSEKLVGLGERIVIGTAYKHHLLTEEAPPPRERQGPSGIVSLIPEEFIERRMEEEVEG